LLACSFSPNVAKVSLVYMNMLMIQQVLAQPVWRTQGALK